MSFGRFIIECDIENFAIAGMAAEYMMKHPESKEVMTSYGKDSDKVSMFSKRLKKSIRIQQVKP